MPETLYRCRLLVDPLDWLFPGGDPGSEKPVLTSADAITFWKSVGLIPNAVLQVTAEIYWFLRDAWGDDFILVPGQDEPPRPEDL